MLRVVMRFLVVELHGGNFDVLTVRGFVAVIKQIFLSLNGGSPNVLILKRGIGRLVRVPSTSLIRGLVPGRRRLEPGRLKRRDECLRLGVCRAEPRRGMLRVCVFRAVR